MPVHDWTRVDAGTFHAFHTLWIGEIMKALNAGLLPRTGTTPWPSRSPRGCRPTS